jgi:hypothetical protein
LEEQYELTRYGAVLGEIAAKRGLTLEQVVEVTAYTGDDPEVLRALIYRECFPELRSEIYESMYSALRASIIPQGLCMSSGV